MLNAKTHFAGGTVEVFKFFLQIHARDEAADIEPMRLVVNKWEEECSHALQEMMESLYGRLALAILSKSGEIRREFRKLMRKYNVVVQEKITPRTLTLLDDQKLRTDALELASELYWLDNSPEAGKDIFKLITRNFPQLDPWYATKFARFVFKHVPGAEVWEDSNKLLQMSIDKKSMAHTAMTDNKIFPFACYAYLQKVFQWREEEREDEITKQTVFTLANYFLIPFLRTLTSRGLVMSSEAHHAEKLEDFLNGDLVYNTYFDSLNDLDMGNEEMAQTIVFNQQLIETILFPFTDYLASLGLSVKDIISKEDTPLLHTFPCNFHDFSHWLDEESGMTVRMCSDFYEPLPQTAFYLQQLLHGQTWSREDVPKAIADAFDEETANTLTYAHLPEYLHCTPQSTAYQMAVDKEFKVQTFLPFQHFIAVLLCNLAGQIVELKRSIATQDNAVERTAGNSNSGKLRTELENTQRMNKKLQSENAELKKRLAEMERAHKQQLDAAVKKAKAEDAESLRRHKINFNAAQDELTKAKRELRETREALEEEIMQRIAAEDTHEEEPAAPEVEETVTDEALVEAIREFSKKRKIVVVGGTLYWKNRLSAMYPDIEFYNAAAKKRDHPGRMLSMTGVDYFVANVFNTSHLLYNATTQMTRVHGIPLFYMPYGQSVNRFNEVMRSIMATDKEESK